MARRVIWSESALGDLEAAADYIAEDSPTYASALVERALSAARSLSHFANRGHVVPELEDPTIRELFVRRFRLLYEVGEDAVDILGFIHGARDLRKAVADRPRPR